MLTPVAMTRPVLKLRTAVKDDRRLSKIERSAYFARREAAKVLHSVLLGDVRRRAAGSIKSLIYNSSVRNKKGTFALVCQTLKHLFIIKEVLETSNALIGKWKSQKELMYVITYDLLFGQEIFLVGAPENFLLLRTVSLQTILARILVRNGVRHVKDLMAAQQFPDVSKPVFVRVNTLKLDTKFALQELEKQFKVQEDSMVPDLLILPVGTDLHDHPYVKNGSIFIQGKASSMASVALEPKNDWEVIDACAAPGNKTVHLAALMRGNGKITACELNKDRIKRLDEAIILSGASNVKTLHGDFLNINPEDPLFSKVRAILLDPSCSGSGTAAERLDHLLPSYSGGEGSDVAERERLIKLAAFQKKALAHALSFPCVERIVYSTCSVNQIENEDVVKAVLPLATTNGFQLAMPFPKWPRRGLPVLNASECLIRTDPTEDKEGFFIALFVRKSSPQLIRKSRSKRKPIVPFRSSKISMMMMLHHSFNSQKRCAR